MKRRAAFIGSESTQPGHLWRGYRKSEISRGNHQTLRGAANVAPFFFGVVSSRGALFHHAAAWSAVVHANPGGSFRQRRRFMIARAAFIVSSAVLAAASALIIGICAFILVGLWWQMIL